MPALKSFAFRGKEQDITKIAETLRVRTVLEGSVRRAGNRIRVTAQLIDAENGSHLWSERYDRDMTDIFAIQDEIGQAISEALKVRLTSTTHTVNIEAWQNHLKGQYHLLLYRPESMAKAKECFDRALAIDPNYTPAHCGLARYYFLLAAVGIKPACDMAPLAKSAGEKALAIDPTNSETHSVLAVIAAMFDYNWKFAEAHFRQAMAANPVPPLVRLRYALYYLLPFGRVAEAMEQCRSELENDPLSMLLHWETAYSMLCGKQYREAIEYARRALEIDANFYMIWGVIGLAQLGAGLAQEAITSLKRSLDLAPWWYLRRVVPVRTYFHAGDHERQPGIGHGSSPTRPVTASVPRCTTPPSAKGIRCLKRSTWPTGSATWGFSSRLLTYRSSILTAPTRVSTPCLQK